MIISMYKCLSGHCVINILKKENNVFKYNFIFFIQILFFLVSCTPGYGMVPHKRDTITLTTDVPGRHRIYRDSMS